MQGKCGGGRGLSPVSTVPGRWSPASTSFSCWWHKPQGCHPPEDAAVTSPKPSVSWRCWDGPPPHWAHSTLPASCASSFQRLWKSGCLRGWGGRLPHWKIPEDRGSTRQPVHSPSALPSWVDSAGRFTLPGLLVPHHSLQKPQLAVGLPWGPSGHRLPGPPCQATTAGESGLVLPGCMDSREGRHSKGLSSADLDKPPPLPPLPEWAWGR